MRFADYPKYKPSGVDWLGDVPEHWEVRRLKYSASINDEALPETTDPAYEMSYIDISSVDATLGIVAREEMSFEDAPSRARRVVRNGDTIVSTVRTYLQAIAPIRDTAPNTIVSTGFAVVRPRRVSPEFMAYALREPGFVEAIVARSVGVSYPAVNAAEIGTLPIPLPTDDEQRAIADFLDRETAKIDTLVAKKRLLIERLKEKRTALISRTVTRGLPPDAARAASLDPHPKLKPSGIDWLGDVPEHWTITKGRFAGTLLGSMAITEDNISEDEEGTPYAKVDDLNYVDSTLLLNTTKLSVSGVASRRRRMLLFPKRGAAIFTNKVVIADGPYLFDSNLMGWEISHRADLKFMAYCLMARRLDDLADVSSVPQINNKHINPAHFPGPPLSEQRAIADFLDGETAKIDDMVAKVEAAIDRLQEYRTALITAAVTGKIDVRGLNGADAAGTMTA